MSKINRKKLIIEVAVITIILGGILLASFILWSVNQEPDPHAKYKELYNTIASYNFNRGKDPKLEARLNEGLNPNFNAGEQLHFNLRARANYFAGLGYYNTAIVDLEKALPEAPNNAEYRATLVQLIDLAHRLNDLDRETEYQRSLDRIL